MEAYDLYLRGVDYSRRGQKDENEIAIDLFKRSLAADPSFAEAYANLAGTYFKRTSRYGESQQWLDSAIMLAKRSLALDKNLASGHLALSGAYLLKGRFDVAIAELERASRLDPSAGSPLVNIGIIRASRGEVDAAIRAFQQALRVEPSRANIIYANLAAAYAELGLIDEATQATERAQSLEPDMAHVGSNIVWLALLRRDYARARQAADVLTTENPTDARSWVVAGEAYLYAGDLAAAHTRFSRAYAISADAFGIFTYIRPLLAYTSLRTGSESRGRELIAEFKDFAAQEMAQGNRQREVLLGLCEAHALSGEHAAAIRLFRETIAAGWNDSWFLRRDPLMASIRADPRFSRELAQVEVRVARMRRAVATAHNPPAARR
jgi:tetratricopeptide (TPR) repeat protein